MRARIPARWEDVSPAWMTAVLAKTQPQLRVREVELVTRDDGTNRRARFAMRYDGEAGPATVFAKAHTAKHRIVHLRNGNLFNEARLFASGVPLPLEHPKVYYATIDRLRLDFLLVMEDLVARGADPRDASRPLSVAQVADGLRGLARLHSRYWNFSSRTHRALSWVKTWQPSRGWQLGLRRCVPIGLQRAVGQLPDAVLQLDGDRIVDLWARYVHSLSQGPVTLLHGDAHIGNCYVLPDGGVGFLDWQVARRGGWSQDVAYFMVGALTEDDRRTHEASLLEIYREALTLPEGERPTCDEIRLHYRAAQAYGLAIWLSTLGTQGYQTQAISLALAQRYAAAFVENETVAALDAIGV